MRFLIITSALIGLSIPGPAQASTPTNIPVPIVGETVSASTPIVDSNGNRGNLTFFAPASVTCNPDMRFCGFKAFLYTDLPNITKRGYPSMIGTYAGANGRYFTAPVESSGISEFMYFEIARIDTTVGYIQFRDTTLQVKLKTTVPKSIKRLSSTEFKKSCNSKMGAVYGKWLVSCEKSSGKTKQWQIAPRDPDSVIFDASAACALDSRFSKLGDDDKTLSLSNVFLSEFGITESNWQCVVRVLKIPLFVTTQIAETRAIDGRQSATFGKITASWTYHPDQGLNIILNSR